ncbi:hypothetical protein POPTR_001G022150v4 [Populus trichocarpa]|uniref:Uncharacterized protein n=1 Tax=Populus trichocarpa TaxID=3694 RepID=A0ACC0TGF4_POPTR|nr:hypothetical protein BDE02_01G021000 [Populus trichocarpa]KAI9400692.1 hypothetical protein POPTR_001G022150v4 [Populus trichocarpa]
MRAFLFHAQNFTTMHIPQSAIPAIMNVFANLESFEINLCNYPSRTSHPSYRQNITKMKVKWDDEELHVPRSMMNELRILIRNSMGHHLEVPESSEEIFSFFFGRIILCFSYVDTHVCLLCETLNIT